MPNRGYALPLVFALVLILSLILTTVLFTTVGSVAVGESMLHRRQAFHAADGVSLAAMDLASQKLRTLPSQPDLPLNDPGYPLALATMLEDQATATSAFVNSNKSFFTPPGYAVEDVAVTGLGAAVQQLLDSGAFAGMLAQVQPLQLAVAVRRDHDRTPATVVLRSSIERATISMFQFFAFIDGYAFVFNGPGAKFFGRVHANGDMCIGSGSDSFLETITSGGKIYRLRGSGCRNEISGGLSGSSPSPTVFVSTDGFPTPFATSAFALLNKDADSPTWVTDVNAWKGTIAHVSDSTHGTPKLKPPIIGVPLTQQGRNAIHALRPNNENSRFLIDPVLPGESSDIARQKMAFKADIRIVDGIWYRRNPANPQELGTPIWSDHPGRMNAGHVDDRWAGPGKTVGQDDLFGGPRPQRYSWYRTDSAGSAGLAAPPTTFRPVVSYGSLFRKAGPVWVPGFYEGTAVATAGCTATSPTAACFPVKEATTTAQLLQGTRSGFRSAWDESGVTDGAADCGANRTTTLSLGVTDERRTAQVNMLPLNFDVGAFHEAMATTAGGELGSHFSAANPFNGIVYVSATWPGFRDGFGTVATSGAAGMWPFQGLQSDPFSGVLPNTLASGQPQDNLGSLTNLATYPGLPFTVSGSALDISVASRQGNAPFQQALAYPFCSDDLSTNTTAAELAAFNDANTFSGAGGARHFYAPKCSRYHDSTASARINGHINSVRIINASNMDPAILPIGLTVVSNLPVYILGSLNTTSGPAATPTVLGNHPLQSQVTPWSPVLIGGDTISLLSNDWTDDEAPWNIPVRAYWHMRKPSNTQINGAFLYGWAEAALNPATNTGCREELTYSIRLHEEWSVAAGIERVIRGSIFVGWNSVYGAAFSDVHADNGSGAWHDTDGSTKIYGYDYHFDLLTNQPPGAPVYEIRKVTGVLAQ